MPVPVPPLPEEFLLPFGHDAEGWLYESDAGVHITGPSGCGKSTLLRQITRTAASMRIRGVRPVVVVIDPKGDLAHDSARDMLKLGRSKDLVYSQPGEMSVPVVPIDPIGVDEKEASEYELGARRACKVDYAALTTQHSIGGTGDFGVMVQLYLWTQVILQSCSEMGLTYADSLHFVHGIGGEVHDQLRTHVPHLMDALTLEQLASLRPDLQDQVIAAARARFTNILRNPINVARFGTKRVRPFADFAEQGAILFEDLSCCGNLRHTDPGIHANFRFQDAVLYVLSRRDRSIPVFLIVDECPMLTASHTLITNLLPILRALNARLVVADQGAHTYDR